MTRRGERYILPRGAVKQRQAQLTPQARDLLGQRRLRDIGPLGRAAEVPVARDGAEVLELAQLHSASP